LFVDKMKKFGAGVGIKWSVRQVSKIITMAHHDNLSVPTS